MKQEGEFPSVLGKLWVVDGPARGDLGGVNFERYSGKGCLGISPKSIGVAVDDDVEVSEAEELPGSSWILFSSSKFICSDSTGPFGEQLSDETSQRRFDGLTPGSKPSDGPKYKNKL